MHLSSIVSLLLAVLSCIIDALKNTLISIQTWARSVNWEGHFMGWPLTAIEVGALPITLFCISALYTKRRAREITGIKKRKIKRFVDIKVEFSLRNVYGNQVGTKNKSWRKLKKIIWDGEYKDKDYAAVILQGEAGCGKSILMEQLYYQMEKRRQRWMLLEKLHKDIVPTVQFERCHRLTLKSVEDLLAWKDTSDQGRRILFLDALDELPVEKFDDKWVKEISIDQKSRYTTLVISSRKNAVRELTNISVPLEGSRVGSVFPLAVGLPDAVKKKTALKIFRKNFVLDDGIPPTISRESEIEKQPAIKERTADKMWRLVCKKLGFLNKKTGKEVEFPRMKRKGDAAKKPWKWIADAGTFLYEKTRIGIKLRGYLKSKTSFWHSPFYAANAHLLQKTKKTTSSEEIERAMVNKRINAQCKKPSRAPHPEPIVVLNLLIDIAKNLGHQPLVSEVKEKAKSYAERESCNEGMLLADICTFLVGKKNSTDEGDSGNYSFEEYKFYGYFRAQPIKSALVEKRADELSEEQQALQEIFDRLKGFDPRDKYSSLKRISEGIGTLQNLGGYAWQALDFYEKEKKVLLITRDIVDELAFETSGKGKRWSACTLRNYLNDENKGWLQKLYKNDNRLQGRILKTDIVTQDSAWEPFGGEEDLSKDDYVFILSVEELAEYFGDSGALANRTRSTNYVDDAFNERRIAYYKEEPNCWWLRSPGYSSADAACVDYYGNVYVDGNFVSGVGIGVRPALWLNLESAIS